VREVGPPWAVAGARRRKGKRPAGPVWMRAKSEGRGGVRGRGFCLFLKKILSNSFSNIQTPIKQNPCIRIMMHKHLLFLNYFSDVEIF
jgi:hypothetical protein